MADLRKISYDDIFRINRWYLLTPLSDDPYKNLELHRQIKEELNFDWIDGAPELNFSAYLSGKIFLNINDKQVRELNNFIKKIAIGKKIKKPLFPLFKKKDLLYPIHQKVDFWAAYKTVSDFKIKKLKHYLKIFGLDYANEIKNWKVKKIFFYLTHFWGRVDQSVENLIRQSRYREVSALAKNRITQLLVDNFFYRYDKDLWPEFYYFYQLYNQNLNLPHYKQVGAFDFMFFATNLVDYLRLIKRPSNFLETPPTLTSIKNLMDNGVTVDENVLAYFTDDELLYLLGTNLLNNIIARPNLINKAARWLNKNRVYLVLPTDFKVGLNQYSKINLQDFSEWEFPFFGIGELNKGLKFYGIDEVVGAFEKTRDELGYYTFKDPLDWNQNFTFKEIKGMAKALESKQWNVPENLELSNLFKNYVRIYDNQIDPYGAPIVFFKDWFQKHQESLNNFRKALKNLFRIGMYMRQWKGKPYPYPISEKDTGTAIEGSKLSEIELAKLEKMTGGIEDNKQKFLENIAKVDKEVEAKLWSITPRTKRKGEEIQRLNKSFRYLWDEVFRGDYCIRLASAAWCYTMGQIYWEVFNKNIKGFDIYEGLDKIS